MLQQISKASCQDNQQNHHKTGCVENPPLPDHDLPKRIHRSTVTRELEQAHQPEHAQESQIEEVMQEHLEEERQHRQQVDDGVTALGIRQPRDRIVTVLKLWLFRDRVEAKQILSRKNRNRDVIQELEFPNQNVVDRGHGLKNDRKHRDQDPNHQEVVEQHV